MLNQLAYRNAKCSIKHYVVYLCTMVFIVSIMLAFTSMIFSKDIQKICEMGALFAVMLALASLFVMFILAWLMDYMIRFMFEKRSKEFGIYLLLGMNNKQVVRLFQRENQLIGVVAFLLGIIPGMILQQLCSYLFYSFFSQEYKMAIAFSGMSFIATLILYSGALGVALCRNKRRLNRMNIKDLMTVSQKNEEIGQENIYLQLGMFAISIGYIIFFCIGMFKGIFSSEVMIFLIVGLVISSYMFYSGLACMVMQYVNKGKEYLLKGTRLFVLRQLAAKIKTMRFIMGTLTIFFTVVLIGVNTAIMFNDYQRTQLEAKLPFDIIMFSDDVNDDFDEILAEIEKENVINDKLIYKIYEDESVSFNQSIYKHLGQTSNMPVEYNSGNQKDYFDYDTYMKYSDYQRLRQMLGYDKVTLDSSSYLIHSKSKVVDYFKEDINGQSLNKNGKELKFAGYYNEGFSQNGINGADYVVVVPDDVIEAMTAYYSLIAIDIEGDASNELYKKLCELNNYINPNTREMECNITWGRGSDDFITCTSTTQVKVPQANEIKFVLTAVAYPAIYIGIVFLCVALTILSVEQLSDSNKYKFRYQVLSKLGLDQKAINKVVLKQLALFYLCPVIVALIISSCLNLYIGNRFVFCTGIQTSVGVYYGASIVVFFVVYAIYFVGTYLQVIKDIAE